MPKNSLSFAPRMAGEFAEVVICLPENMGGNAKVYLRERAKKLPEYSQPINTGIAGRSNHGDQIPVDTVGKWLFGVPGYQGHITVSNWEGTECIVRFPCESHEVVHSLVASIKKLVEVVHV